MLTSMIRIAIYMFIIATTAYIISLAIATSSVQEDDPNWDCVTMGNQICGVGAEIGTALICDNVNGRIVCVEY